MGDSCRSAAEVWRAYQKSFGNGFVCQPGTWFPDEAGRRHRERLDNAGISAAVSVRNAAASMSSELDLADSSHRLIVPSEQHPVDRHLGIAGPQKTVRGVGSKFIVQRSNQFPYPQLSVALNTSA
jgi:hypothetical protein